MPMYKVDSEGTPNTAVHLHLHVRGCRCHPDSVSFTWTSHSKFDPNVRRPLSGRALRLCELVTLLRNAYFVVVSPSSLVET